MLFQELLTLVDHLDKEGKGFVSIDEFVHGLQSIRTSACVANFTPPPLRAIGRQKNYSDKVLIYKTTVVVVSK